MKLGDMTIEQLSGFARSAADIDLGSPHHHERVRGEFLRALADRLEATNDQSKLMAEIERERDELKVNRDAWKWAAQGRDEYVAEIDEEIENQAKLIAELEAKVEVLESSLRLSIRYDEKSEMLAKLNTELQRSQAAIE